MRPNTLAEAVERVRAGVSQDVAMAEFVDSFLVAPDKSARFSAIEREPELSGNVRLDALVAAMAEYLAKQYRLGRVPAWASQARRCPLSVPLSFVPTTSLLRSGRSAGRVVICHT